MKQILFAMIFMAGIASNAEQTVAEKAKTAVKKVGNEMNKVANKIDEQVCEKINGKIQCLAKKTKHYLQETTQDIEIKAEELKDKAD